MTSVEKVNEIERRLESWLLVESDSQESYQRVNAGKHRQRLRTQSSELVDLSNVVVSRAVHEYSGPKGLGWLVEITVTIDQELWFRVIDFGPQNLTKPWKKRIEVLP